METMTDLDAQSNKGEPLKIVVEREGLTPYGTLSTRITAVYINGESVPFEVKDQTVHFVGSERWVTVENEPGGTKRAYFHTIKPLGGSS